MNVILLVTIFSLIIPSKQALHMFQQNRYESKRYSMWLKDNFKTNQKNNIIAMFFIVVAFVRIYYQSFHFFNNYFNLFNHACFGRIKKGIY